MKNLYKLKTTGLLLMLAMNIQSSYAQDVTTVEANSEEISENLNLEAVASIFADSKDLEAFEHELNDPKTQISNLDLNEDGQVDYLRVMESVENDTHVVAIQAVLGDDLYQDVATIEVEKDTEGNPRLQLVGDVYLYGPNYIIEPVYVYRPVIFSVFWRPYYRPYRSVFYWGYYPRHWHYWRPLHVHHYNKHVHVHVNVRHTYHRTTVRRSATAVRVHSGLRRNDFARIQPNKSYTARKVAVNKANGTKVRTTGVNQANGNKYRKVGVNQADGDKYRAKSVKQADGDTYRVAGVNKADGTKKRVASVEKSNGSKKTVAVKQNPNGSKRAVSVTKKADGSRTVKTARKPATNKKQSKSRTKSSKRNSKGKR